jgi:methyl-accepting chemotaxis protein
MKSMFSNLKISGKLFLTPLVGIVFLTVLAVVASIGLYSQKTSIVDITARFKGYQNISRIINDVANAHANIYGVLSWTGANYDPKRIDALAKEQMASLDRNIASMQEFLKSGGLNGAEKSLYQTSLTQLVDYKKAASGVIDIASTNISMATTYMSLAAGKYQALSKSLQDLLELENKLSGEEYEHSLRRFSLTVSLFAVLFALALPLSVLAGIIILRKMVISPIQSIAAAAEKISEGDLTFTVEAGGNDEIGRAAVLLKESFKSLGRILQSIKDMSARISQVVQEVERDSKTVVTSAEVEAEAIANISSSMEELNATAADIALNTENLAVSTEQTSSSIEEVVSSISSINDNIRDLSTSIESTSSSIEELSASINEVAGNATHLAQASEESLSAVSKITSAIRDVEVHAKESAVQSQKVTSEAATLGMTSIEKTVLGMKNIKSSVEQTMDFITTLGERSDEIGKILDVIDEVMERTHILYLNAAIIAAGAGEHGKGFAVVAAEINDLAQRTALSTKEIVALIQAVQQDVKNVAEAMRKGILSVEDGFSLAGEAGDALKKILESSESSSQMTQRIEHATAEQAEAARLVVLAMERVRDMTESIAKSTAEQSRGAALIMQATDSMRNASRQVSKATEEQASTSEQIVGAVDNVSARSQQISKSLLETKKNSQNILHSVEEVKNIPEENRKLAFRINKMLWDLQKDADQLKTELERFKL